MTTLVLYICCVPAVLRSDLTAIEIKWYIIIIIIIIIMVRNWYEFAPWSTVEVIRYRCNLTLTFDLQSYSSTSTIHPLCVSDIGSPRSNVGRTSPYLLDGGVGSILDAGKTKETYADIST